MSYGFIIILLSSGLVDFILRFVSPSKFLVSMYPSPLIYNTIYFRKIFFKDY